MYIFTEPPLGKTIKATTINTSTPTTTTTNATMIMTDNYYQNASPKTSTLITITVTINTTKTTLITIITTTNSMTIIPIRQPSPKRKPRPAPSTLTPLFYTLTVIIYRWPPRVLPPLLPRHSQPPPQLQTPPRPCTVNHFTTITISTTASVHTQKFGNNLSNKCSKMVNDDHRWHDLCQNHHFLYFDLMQRNWLASGTKVLELGCTSWSIFSPFYCFSWWYLLVSGTWRPQHFIFTIQDLRGSFSSSLLQLV